MVYGSYFKQTLETSFKSIMQCVLDFNNPDIIDHIEYSHKHPGSQTINLFEMLKLPLPINRIMKSCGTFTWIPGKSISKNSDYVVTIECSQKIDRKVNKFTQIHSKALKTA
jgi:hypothetical protein